MSQIFQDKKELIVDSISEENGPSSLKFESALKPLIVWLKLSTGIDITRTKTNEENKTKISIICLFLHGIFMVLFNFVSTALFNYFYLQQRVTFPATVIINGTSVPPPTNEYINFLTVVFITAVEYTHTCGMHLGFFCLQYRFKALWNSLLIIEKEFKICEFIYRRIRLSLWIGFAIILLVIHFQLF